MPKNLHEIRDPIHVFVRLDSDERKVLSSRCFQRLRHIHQLALTYLVYPGATHKRFEHSLGVMELAARVYDVVTNPTHTTDDLRGRLEPLTNDDQKDYWRRVLRMAALCHDVGHLPFSHAAEKELLPKCWDHERITRAIISSDEMRAIWDGVTPPLRHEDIVKLALGLEKAHDLEFSDWENLLSEIIVGDALGVDRMDYLLRDSHHIGVAYGRFDHYRLIDTLRILPAPEHEVGRSDDPVGGAPALGVDGGGIQSAEALVLARYFMYSQVYFHAVRRIYDIHLMDFLKDWIANGRFSIDISEHFKITDNEVSAGILKSAMDDQEPGHVHARRILERDHFKVIYERNSRDVNVNPEAGEAVFGALSGKFGAQNFRYDRIRQGGGEFGFPVRRRDGEVVSSLTVSEVLKAVPTISAEYVFADRGVMAAAGAWLKENGDDVIELDRRSEHDGKA